MQSDRIWITRKSRIIAEQRFLRANSISNFLVIWYSFTLMVVTIWNLKYPNDYLNIFLIFGSIAVLIASVVVASQKYSERSLAMKNCYLKLDELYLKVKRAEGNLDEQLLQNLEGEYLTIIQNVENHSDNDYLTLRFNLRNHKDTTFNKFNKFDYVQYYFEKFKGNFVIVLLFLLPFLLTYMWRLV